MVARISSNSQHCIVKRRVLLSIPAGSTGFELIICVSRSGANTDCLEEPPVTVTLLKPDMLAMV